MKKHLLILLIPLLAGCTSSEVTSGSVTTTTSDTVIPQDGSLKEILTYLSMGKNYTFAHYANGEFTNEFQFSETSVATIGKRPEELKMYLSDEMGIYGVEYHNEAYLAGEYIDTTNDLFNSEIIPTFFNKGNDFINSLNDDVTSVDVKDKSFKMDTIQVFGYSRLDYVNINSFTVTYLDKSVIFEIALANDNLIHKYVSKNLGTTSVIEAKDFLNNGGKVFTPDYDIKVTRDYFLNNNFVRKIFDINARTYVGEELFNDKYFYSETSATTNQVYIELNYNGPDPVDEKTNINLCGVYYGYLYGTRNKGFTNISMFSQPYNKKPDVKETFHYPCYLSLWNKLQYLSIDKAVNNEFYRSTGVVYTFTDSDMIVDFANNFSLDTAYPLNTCPPYKVSIDVALVDDNPAKSKITFLYYFRNAGDDYCVPFPFSEFGSANIALVDQVVKQYSK